MNAEEAKVINSLAMNQLFVLQIESVNDMCDALIDDETKMYSEVEGMLVERNGLKYFTIGTDNFGGFKNTHDFDVLLELKNKYGDKFMQYKEDIE